MLHALSEIFSRIINRSIPETILLRIVPGLGHFLRSTVTRQFPCEFPWRRGSYQANGQAWARDLGKTRWQKKI